jgi:hypothetical protein
MGKNQDPGSGINIPDPPHCWVPLKYFKTLSADLLISLKFTRV